MTRDFTELYRVPQRTDADGTVWSRFLTDIDFASSAVWWAVGSGQILSTKDAGRTWKNHYSDYMGKLLFHPGKVAAITNTSCCVIDVVGHGPVKCFYTKDAGEHWKEVLLGTLVYPRALAFKDSQCGWIVSDDGKTLNERSQIHITRNGGQTWDAHRLAVKGKPESIAFSTPKIGWLVERIISKDEANSSGELYKSCDGGQSWELVATFNHRILDVFALDATRLLVCGEKGFIATTEDGWAHWSVARTKTHSNINSIASDRELRLFALGDYDALLASENRGVDWRKLKTPTEHSNYIGAYIESLTNVIVCSSTGIYLVDAFSTWGF